MSSTAFSTVQPSIPLHISTSPKKSQTLRKPRKSKTKTPEVVVEGTERTSRAATGNISNQTETVSKPITSTSSAKSIIITPEGKPAQHKRHWKKKKTVTTKATIVKGNVLPENEAKVPLEMDSDRIQVPEQVSERTKLPAEALVATNKGVEEEEEEEQPEEAAPKSKGQKARIKKERQTRHYDLVISGARATISILQDHGFFCAIFGSLACKLYGGTRCPKDVDLLVFEPPSSDPKKPMRTSEEVKKLMLDVDPRHFFLTLPRDPEATFRILHYRQEYLEPSCKVDILLPGTMHLPLLSPISSPSSESPETSTISTLGGPLMSLDTNTPLPSPHNRIQTKRGFPVVPFSLLLLHKLQGWDDHKKSPEEHKQKKQPQDVADIRRLFTLEENIMELKKIQPWTDPELFSEEFQQLTKERVKEFCKEFPTTTESWQQLGFETS